VAFGEPDAGGSERAEALAQIFRCAGLRAEVCDDTELMLWEKFCLMAGTSAATTLTRQNIGVVRSVADMRALLVSAIGETAQVGRALGVALDDGIEQRTLASLDASPANARASQLTDLERGRRLELDGLSGALVRLGREHGVPTPTHTTVYAALKPFKNGLSNA
jgi:2-dehydropantoate 2-reductase